MVFSARVRLEMDLVFVMRNLQLQSIKALLMQSALHDESVFVLQN